MENIPIPNAPLTFQRGARWNLEGLSDSTSIRDVERASPVPRRQLRLLARAEERVLSDGLIWRGNRIRENLEQPADELPDPLRVIQVGSVVDGSGQGVPGIADPEIKLGMGRMKTLRDLLYLEITPMRQPIFGVLV